MRWGEEKRLLNKLRIGTIVCGGVEIGEGSLIGANATLTQYIKIGKESFVKAGSLVKADYNAG